ncbi:hypothetical protein ACFWIA_01865 [Streptomyces sp. NPDC127068]|uniref:hypothetical protein n=1 Tax=Streptomyces sp. NPDC127068 TaxID=3347127 RepID=UPI00365DEDE0
MPDPSSPAAERKPHTDLPDARLVRLLRASAAVAYPASFELRRRHHSATFAYAQVCAVDDGAARRMAAQAFAQAVRQAKGGRRLPGSWRHHTLLLVHEVAAQWAGGGLRTDVRADLLNSLSAPRDDRPQHEALLRPAYDALPLGMREAVWYGAAERLDPAECVRFTGLHAKDLVQQRDAGMRRLARAFAQNHIEAHGTAKCRGYRRLIEEGALRRPPHVATGLYHHIKDCTGCLSAYNRLHQLWRSPEAFLPEALLPWAGASYAAAVAARTHPGPAAGRRTADGTGAPPEPPKRHRRPSASKGVCAVPALALRGRVARRRAVAPARGAGGACPPSESRACGSHVGGSAPAVTRTGAGRAAPSRLPWGAWGVTTVAVLALPLVWALSLTADGTLRSAVDPPPRTGEPASGGPPDGSRALAPERTGRLVHVSTGLCLDVATAASGAKVADGEDAVARAAAGQAGVARDCDDSKNQVWRLSTTPGVIRAEEADLCLDSRERTRDGAGLTPCDDGTPHFGYVLGRDGLLRSAAVPGYVLVPDGLRADTPLTLVPEAGAGGGTPRAPFGPGGLAWELRQANPDVLAD